MSDDLERISITIPESLLSSFDEVTDGWEYDTRSEAVRDAMRSFLQQYQKETALDRPQRGAIVILYDHHETDLDDQLTTIQHEMNEHIIAVQHIHLTSNICMETIAIDGPGNAIQDLTTRLRSLSGVLYVEAAVVADPA